MVAYVYLLEEVPFEPNASSEWTKIGCSKNPPEWRVGANLMRGNPRILKLPVVYEFTTEQEAYQAEFLAHENFKTFFCRKEWFNLSWLHIAE
jgi:hypothetical protein